jgi:hypothetical protein
MPPRIKFRNTVYVPRWSLAGLALTLQYILDTIWHPPGSVLAYSDRDWGPPGQGVGAPWVLPQVWGRGENTEFLGLSLLLGAAPGRSPQRSSFAKSLPGRRDLDVGSSVGYRRFDKEQCFSNRGGGSGPREK